jgi:carbon storage regulator
MLILNRLVGESLIIDNDIVVTVLGFNRERIKIGIDAPKNISVHREEIYNQIKENCRK